MSLRVLLLIIAGLFMLGIVIDSLRRRSHKQAKAAKVEPTPNSTPARAAFEEDGVLGPVRVINNIDLEIEEELKPLKSPPYEFNSNSKPMEPQSRVEPTLLQPSLVAEPSHEPVNIDDLAQTVHPLQTPAAEVMEPALEINQYEAPMPSNTHANMNMANSKKYITFHLMAQKGKKFAGYDLLQNFTAVGLRHGSLDIFHYYEKKHVQKELLFSVAQAVEPGTFDIHRIGAINTPGLIIFMDVNVTDPTNAYRTMLSVIQKLADSLDGEICDDQRELCSQDYLQYCLQRLMQEKELA